MKYEISAVPSIIDHIFIQLLQALEIHIFLKRCDEIGAIHQSFTHKHSDNLGQILGLTLLLLFPLLLLQSGATAATIPSSCQRIIICAFPIVIITHIIRTGL